MKYVYYMQNGTTINSLLEGYKDFYIADNIESDSTLNRYFYLGDRIQYSLDAFIDLSGN